MQVTETTSSGQVTAGASQEAKKQDLDKDAFLKMLILELQNQDPMQPMEDREFLAQLAQFSALEQLRNLSQQFQVGQALSLIGRTAHAINPEDGEPISGVVQSIKFADGVPTLMIDGHEVELSYVTSVE